MRNLVLFTGAIGLLQQGCASPPRVVEDACGGYYADEGTPCSQGDCERARLLLKYAHALAQRQRWAEAAKQYCRAFRMHPTPDVLFEVGVSSFRAGRAVEAARAFEVFLEIADESRYASKIARARQHRDELAHIVARVEFRIAPPDARVMIDGLETTQSWFVVELDPGLHYVSVAAEAHNEQSLALWVLPGSQAIHEIVLWEEPPPVQ